MAYSRSKWGGSKKYVNGYSWQCSRTGSIPQLSKRLVMLPIRTIYDLKPRFQAMLRPLVGWLASRGVTPNQITVGALLLSILTGAILLAWPEQPRLLLLLPPLLLIRMALNAIDGMLAREHALQSRLGALLNELGDVLADAVLYLPLARLPDIDPILLVSVVLLGIVAEMAGVVTVTIGASRRYDGPLGKSDRAFVFGLLGLLLGSGLSAGPWLTVGLWIMLGLAGKTLFNRVQRGLQETTP